MEYKQPVLALSATQTIPVQKPSVAPVSEPESVQQPLPPRRKFWIAIVVAAIVLLVVAMFWRRGMGAHNAVVAGEGTRLAVVEQKDFVRTVRVHGIVEAVESHMIAAPRLSGQGLGSLIITKLVHNGSQVHKGDLLVEFDRQAQLKVVLDKKAEYRDLLEQIKKKQAEQDAARAADETGVKQAEDAAQTAELEVKKNEIVSRIDAEKNEQNLEQARATLKQLKETFDLKRQAARAELKILEIQRDRALTAMNWAQGNTEKMQIHAAVEGVAVINSMWKGGSMGEVQEGDEVRAGFPFMQVVDPSRMQVRARVNQSDISSLRQQENVRVNLDAYPDLVFPGKLEVIAAVAQTSSFSEKARTLTVLFSINGTDAKLLPDLSAAVDVERERRHDALVVTRDAILSDNGHSYLRVKTGSGFEKREVKLGEANDVEQMVLSGVEKNAVVMRNPNS